MLALEVSSAASARDVLPETAGAQLVLLRLVRGAGAAQPGVLSECLHRLAQARFVTACEVDGELDDELSHVALACDYLLAGPRALLRVAPGARVHRSLRGRRCMDRDSLVALGLCVPVDSAGDARNFMEGLGQVIGKTAGASIPMLRFATRATHGGADLSRVPRSIAAAATPR